MSTSFNSPEQLAYTMSEVAKLTHLSPRTIWTLINSGQLRCIRIGRAVRVTRRALEEFLAGQESANQ